MKPDPDRWYVYTDTVSQFPMTRPGTSIRRIDPEGFVYSDYGLLGRIVGTFHDRLSAHTHLHELREIRAVLNS